MTWALSLYHYFMMHKDFQAELLENGENSFHFLIIENF